MVRMLRMVLGKKTSAKNTHTTLIQGQRLPCSSCQWLLLCIRTDTGVSWKRHSLDRLSKPRLLGNAVESFERLCGTKEATWQVALSDGGKRGAGKLRWSHARGSVVCVSWSRSAPRHVSTPSTLRPWHRLGASLTSASTVTRHSQLASFTPGSVQ